MALRRKQRPARLERGTLVLAVVALGAAGTAVAGEVGRVWRRGSAELPSQADDLLGAAAVAARETSEVARVSLREASVLESATLNLLVSFLLGFATVRVGATVIRRRGPTGPFRNVVLGRRHIHHFVPGILLAFGSGLVSILSREERLDPWLAIPFGAGLGLTLDESALLLSLDDVYWTEEGVLSVQISLTAVALLAAGVLARRVTRRGEERVLLAAPA
ncbi:MAG TPA: hypothetical protein VGI54_02925 [Solirubrobacteraceae bacterium]